MSVRIIGSERTAQLEKKFKDIFDIQGIKYRYDHEGIKPLTLVFLSKESSVLDIYADIMMLSVYSGDTRDCLVVTLVYDKSVLDDLLSVIDPKSGLTLGNLNVRYCNDNDDIRKIITPFIYYL